MVVCGTVDFTDFHRYKHLEIQVESGNKTTCWYRAQMFFRNFLYNNIENH